jgi:hypothetical protein
MAVLKYYDGSDWEPVASALVGPTGATGATGSTGPTGPNPGLTLINTISFSAVASQSVNDVFSATYKNYKVVFSGVQSTAADMIFRVRVAGSDLSSSTYKRSMLFNYSNSATAVVSNSNSATSIDLVAGATTGFSYLFDIYNPFATSRTLIQTNGTHADGTPYVYNLKGAGLVDDAISYTGFSLIASSGTITGEISVYGFNA